MHVRNTLYTEDEMLMLSGIQHFAFCPRQWWLIHIDQIWAENHLTALGQQMHRRVNDPDQSERRGSIITLRAMPISSTALGLYGVADAVELRQCSSEEGFVHPHYSGYWHPTPVEYKRGGQKRYTKADQLQLCAEAICLEEMCGVNIPFGYLFYGETKHRLEIELTSDLRTETVQIANRMHECLAQGKTIAPKSIPGCRNCSLQDMCLPQVMQCPSVSDYYKKHKIF